MESRDPPARRQRRLTDDARHVALREWIDGTFSRPIGKALRAVLYSHARSVADTVDRLLGAGQLVDLVFGASVDPRTLGRFISVAFTDLFRTSRPLPHKAIKRLARGVAALLARDTNTATLFETLLRDTQTSDWALQALELLCWDYNFIGTRERSALVLVVIVDGGGATTLRMHGNRRDISRASTGSLRWQGANKLPCLVL